MKSYISIANKGYTCYECDSSTDSNCFDIEPMVNTINRVHCDITGTREESCYFAHISGILKILYILINIMKLYYLEHKKRKMIRGCKKTGYCDQIENHEQSNIYFKVLSCGECNDVLCNSSKKNRTSTFLIPLIFLIVIFNFLE